MTTPGASLPPEFLTSQTVQVMKIPQNVLDAVSNSSLGCITMSEFADMLWNQDQQVKDLLAATKPVMPKAESLEDVD
jgi:hypothetical protein